MVSYTLLYPSCLSFSGFKWISPFTELIDNQEISNRMSITERESPGMLILFENLRFYRRGKNEKLKPDQYNFNEQRENFKNL